MRWRGPVGVLLLAALGFALAGCLPAAPAPAAERASEGRPVRVERLELAPVGESYEAVGSVRSRTTSTLSSKILGAVTMMKVQEGSNVRAGQVLLEVDDREVQSQLAKARAGLRQAEDALEEVEQGSRGAQASLDVAEAQRELAQATYDRYRALSERTSVSQQEFDEVHARSKMAVAEANRAREMADSFRSRRKQVLAQIDQARADVRNAEGYANDARIEAPFDGIVTAKHADVGTMASPGVPLLTLEDDRRYRFEAVVEESRVGKIRPGDRVEVRVDATGDRPLEGQVAEIVPTSDSASRSVVVKIELTDPSTPGSTLSKGSARSEEAPVASFAARSSQLAADERTGLPDIGLRSGFFGRARFNVGERRILGVPSTALLERGQLVGVFVVDPEGRARMRLIKTGKNHQQRVEVLSGLEPGDVVIVDGAETLSDGIRVEERHS